VSVHHLASASLVSPPLSLDHEIECGFQSPEIESLFPENMAPVTSDITNNHNDFLLFDDTTDAIPFSFDSLVSFDADTEQFRSDQFDNAIAV